MTINYEDPALNLKAAHQLINQQSAEITNLKLNQQKLVCAIQQLEEEMGAAKEGQKPEGDVKSKMKAKSTNAQATVN